MFHEEIHGTEPHIQPFQYVCHHDRGRNAGSHYLPLLRCMDDHALVTKIYKHSKHTLLHI